MSIRLYGLSQCSTCKKARTWLDQQGLQHEFIDYRANPIAPEQIQAWADEVGWPKVVNRASMTWRQLDDAQKDPQTDAQWLALVKAHEALIRRPVIVTGKGVQFGFSEKKIVSLL